MTKICSVCGEEKDIELFYKDKSKKDGYRGNCIACSSKISKQSYLENRDKRLEKVKEYRTNNAEEVRRKNLEWYYKKRYGSDYEVHLKRAIENAKHRPGRKYTEEEKRERKIISRRKYYLNHKKEVMESNQLRRDRKFLEKPEYKAKAYLRARIYSVLIRSYTKKDNKTLEYLGCSMQEFKNHIENKFINGMSWDNMGEWHLDHIIPCAAFDLTKEEEQKKCFHYTNIQPLWAIDNLSKSDKMPDGTIARFLRSNK